MNEESLGNEAAEFIIGISNELRKISPVESIYRINFKFREISSFSKQDLFHNLEKLYVEKYTSIYSFHLDQDSNRTHFLDLFDESRKRDKGILAYPRPNKQREELSQDCLYVGTSRKTSVRLAEHLGFGHNQTYAMHLSKWANSLDGGIEIRIRKFDLNSGRFHLLTYLEDALARHLKPMLGRRGNL